MIPRHIGIIMDGNGRWAERRGLPRKEGYAAGLAALRKVLERAAERGVKTVTVYAFSTENFARPEEEIRAIVKVADAFDRSYDGDMRVSYMGDIYAFGDEFAEGVESVEARTAGNPGLRLNIAFGYGGRADIVNAAKRAADKGDFTEEDFAANLSSAGLPPLDLVIRSGGEKRLSGFMLYEAAYAELWFTDALWPDFDGDALDEAIASFEGRERKFGA